MAIGAPLAITGRNQPIRVAMPPGSGPLPQNYRMSDGREVGKDGPRGDNLDAVVGPVENPESPELSNKAIHTRAVHLTATGHHRGGHGDRASGRVLRPYKIGVRTLNTEPHMGKTRHSCRQGAARTTDAMYPNQTERRCGKPCTKTKKEKKDAFFEDALWETRKGTREKNHVRE